MEGASIFEGCPVAYELLSRVLVNEGDALCTIEYIIALMKTTPMAIRVFGKRTPFGLS
jgi:hypothetical protein